MTKHTRYALGFIGAGNMAEAIARGVLAAGVYKPDQIIAADPSSQRLALFRDALGTAVTEDSAKIAADTDVIMLAVKPQKIDEALAAISPAISSQTLIISIVSAISTTFIANSLHQRPRIIRVMPNTPMLAGAGASALCRGIAATDADAAIARAIFASCGVAVEVPETLMDAVTSLSGSGPAYVFYLAEAMAAAGEKLGLAPAEAALLARQTIIGAGKLLERSPDSATELRRKVTSPGGFTEAAIKRFETDGFFQLMLAAMQSAQARGRELAR